MPYIKRGTQGEIVAVSQESGDGFMAASEADEGQVNDFLMQLHAEQQGLGETDIGFIRVLEDVIDLLISKNIIRFTDLPEEARQKMQQRQHLRESLTPRLDLLFNEEDKSGFV